MGRHEAVSLRVDWEGVAVSNLLRGITLPLVALSASLRRHAEAFEAAFPSDDRIPQCPACKVPMQPPRPDAGRYTCPECGRVLNIHAPDDCDGMASRFGALKLRVDRFRLV